MITSDGRLEAFSALMEEVGIIAEKAASLPEMGMRLRCMAGNGFNVIHTNGEKDEHQEEIWYNIHKVPRMEQMGDYCNELSIYPMFKDDAKTSKAAAYYQERDTIAGYGQKSNIIVVNMEYGETLRYMAGAFIHELGHFHAACNENRCFIQNDTRTQQMRIEEEVRMWTFDYKLALILGGHIYQTASNNLAKDIIKYWKKRGKNIKTTGRGIVLDKCFGCPETMPLKEKRDGVFINYCLFMAADRYLDPATAKATKIKILLENGMQKRYDKGPAIMKKFLG